MRVWLFLLLLASGLTQAEEVLTFWCHRGVAELKASAERYQRLTGVRVVIESPVNAPVNFEIKAAAGAGPDLFCWGHDRLGDWADAGLLAPVVQAEALTKLGLQPWALQAVRANGQYYGYPLFAESLGVIVNPSLLPKAPTDFNQLAQLATKLPAGVTSFGWPWANTYFSWPLLSAGGGYVFGQDSQQGWLRRDVGLDHPAVVEAAHWWLSQRQAGLLPPAVDAGRIRELYSQRRLAMMLDGPWAWRELDRQPQPWKLVPWPTLNGRPLRPFVGVFVAMINAFSPHQDLAHDFLRHHLLTTAELTAWAASNELGILAQPDAAALQQRDARMALLLASVEQGTVMPNIPAMNRFWAVMATTLDNLATGRQQPAAALAAAAARLRAP